MLFIYPRHKLTRNMQVCPLFECHHGHNSLRQNMFESTHHAVTDIVTKTIFYTPVLEFEYQDDRVSLPIPPSLHRNFRNAVRLWIVTQYIEHITGAYDWLLYHLLWCASTVR